MLSCNDVSHWLIPYPEWSLQWNVITYLHSGSGIHQYKMLIDNYPLPFQSKKGTMTLSIRLSVYTFISSSVWRIVDDITPQSPGQFTPNQVYWDCLLWQKSWSISIRPIRGCPSAKRYGPIPCGHRQSTTTGPIHSKFFSYHTPYFTLLKKCRCELCLGPGCWCAQCFAHFISS